MSETAFLKDLMEEIMSQGYDRQTASHYAALIGDTPVVDGRSNVIVLDGETQVATLKPLKMFSTE